MNDDLRRLRNGLTMYSNYNDGYSMGTGRAASALLDNGSLDSLIENKQREIIRLVAESNDNSNKDNHDTYAKLIAQAQRELNNLVKGKALKEFRRSLLFS
jgi:hypothetical protein